MDGLHSFARTESFTVECDEPEGLGGSNKAPTPTQLFLASLAHCQAITVRIYSDAMGIGLSDIKVKVTGSLDLRGYFSVPGPDGELVDPALHDITIKTFIKSKEPSKKIVSLLRAIKGRGVCLSTVAKGTKMRFSYRHNGKPVNV